jgi:hypothetical protein
MFDDIPMSVENDRETLPPPADWDTSDSRNTIRVIYVDVRRHTRYHTEACITTYLDSVDPHCPCSGEVEEIDAYLARLDA